MPQLLQRVQHCPKKKKAAAQSKVDAFMENCAKRWQTWEGTYQFKRPHLKPDVRDSPEYPCADIDMADIQPFDNVEEYYMVEENLWGTERDAFVSPCFTSNFSSRVAWPGTLASVWVLLVFGRFLFLVGFFLSGKFDFNLMLIPRKKMETGVLGQLTPVQALLLLLHDAPTGKLSCHAWMIFCFVGRYEEFLDTHWCWLQGIMPIGGNVWALASLAITEDVLRAGVLVCWEVVRA